MSDTRKALIAPSHAPQFPDGIGRVPNNPVIAAAFSALFKGGPAARSQSNGWIEEKSRVIYRHHGRLGGVLEIYFGGEDQIPAAQQWELIEGLGTLIVDTLASILAHVCEPLGNARSMYPACQPTKVTAATVLAHKQFRRWGDERRTLMRRIAQDVEALSMLRVDLHRYQRRILRQGDGTTAESPFWVTDYWTSSSCPRFLKRRSFLPRTRHGWCVSASGGNCGSTSRHGSGPARCSGNC
jgi:hypothetical protein